MKLPINLVPVKKITSNVSQSKFSADDIQRIANLILETEGVINPIILRRTGLESYEVIAGHLEYHSAVKAREISPLKGEMIQAIILEDSNEKAILEQIEKLRTHPSSFEELMDEHQLEIINIFQDQIQIKLDQNRKEIFDDLKNFLEDHYASLETKITPSNTSANAIDVSAIEEILRQQEERIIKQVQSRGNSDETVSEVLSNELSEKLQNQISTLEVLHEENVKTILQLKIELQKAGKKPIDRVTKLIQDLNSLDREQILNKLSECGFKKKDAESIVTKILSARESQKFSSLKDIANRKVMSEARIISLLDIWQ
ncbi:MAG: hypothetical protein CV045_01805 [Cyanobacteria bacterium M5B4]|nr:MAG: hypothetical protein CV045_01805 [Cyanobacteria bacterium M5B4]